MRLTGNGYPRELIEETALELLTRKVIEAWQKCELKTYAGNQANVAAKQRASLRTRLRTLLAKIQRTSTLLS